MKSKRRSKLAKAPVEVVSLLSFLTVPSDCVFLSITIGVGFSDFKYELSSDLTGLFPAVNPSFKEGVGILTFSFVKSFFIGEGLFGRDVLCVDLGLLRSVDCSGRKMER